MPPLLRKQLRGLASTIGNHLASGVAAHLEACAHLLEILAQTLVFERNLLNETGIERLLDLDGLDRRTLE